MNARFPTALAPSLALSLALAAVPALATGHFSPDYVHAHLHAGDTMEQVREHFGAPYNASESTGIDGHIVTWHYNSRDQSARTRFSRLRNVAGRVSAYLPASVQPEAYRALGKAYSAQQVADLASDISGADAQSHSISVHFRNGVVMSFELD